MREMQAFEGLGCGETVGCVKLVRDGDPDHGGTGEGVEGDGLGGRIFARPDDEDSGGVLRGPVGAVETGGEAGGDELVGVGAVGGEKEVLRVSVGELLRESGGGAEAGDDVDASLSFVGCGKGRENWLQISGGCYVELGWGLRVLSSSCAKCRESECEEYQGEHSAGAKKEATAVV